jgi:hypothetical protein
MARIFSARTLVLGGLAIGAAAALKNRTKVAGLIGARSSAPEAYPRPSEAPVGAVAAEPGPAPAPAVSNADAAGPPENTATAIPAPEPVVHEPGGGIDEAAEEAAAAAEAANIGGPAPEYAGDEPGEPVADAEIPLEESGEGVSEGLEQAEADLADNAEEAPAPDPASRLTGVEPPAEGTLGPATVDDGAPTGGGTLSGTTSAAEKSANVWKSEASEEDEGEGGSEWQTWSGQAVEPKD